jgi:leader peptidase (prepilin peptidase)/N-methyltransferase
VAGFNVWIWPVLFSPFFGSFLGVVVSRVETPAGIIFGRSACETCGAPIKPFDLVPLVSWAVLRGKCRACAGRIAPFHPAMELGAFAIALWSAAVSTDGALLWASCLLGWTLLALAAADFKYFLLPDFLTLPLIMGGLVAAWLLAPNGFEANVIGGAAGYLFVIILRELYRRLRHREGMGMGDAKLLAASGAWVGWQGLPSVVLLAAVTGLAYALLPFGRSGSLTLTNRVPFGTFLCLGTWIVWLYGPFVVE